MPHIPGDTRLHQARPLGGCRRADPGSRRDRRAGVVVPSTAGSTHPASRTCRPKSRPPASSTSGWSRHPPAGRRRPRSVHPAGPSSGARVTTASAAQVARRNDVVTTLRTRECVVALESIDRMAKGGQAVDAAEIPSPAADGRSQSAATIRSCAAQQEDMAVKLRVSRGDICVDARNELADMLEPGRRPSREQVKTQQEFIESHCTAPVR